MPENKAAWITAQKARPLEVKSAPYTQPGENEVVIKNAALAINPFDWILQDSGNALMYQWLKYPSILGTDVAGEVVEVGSGVTKIRVGERVLGYAVGLAEESNKPSEGAFQNYTVCRSHLVTPIPSSMSYESASVLPLGVATAACGLFQDDQLGLHLPSADPKPKGKTLLVWGGSSSVGSNAIQLAAAAGYEVFTTASPKNFEYMKKLGAAKSFDYRSKTVVQDIIQAFKGKQTAGAFSVGGGSAESCMAVLSKCKGDKFVSMATYPTPDPYTQHLRLVKSIYTFASFSAQAFFKSKFGGFNYKFIFGTTLINNGIGKAIFEEFLPRALAEDRYLAFPEPQVVSQGLESIQSAMETQKKGVSAKKVVVTL